MNIIKEISTNLHNLEIKYSQLSWVKYTTGLDFGVTKAYEDIVNHLKDSDYYNQITNTLDSELNDLDKRSVELLKKEFDPFHKSEEINKLQLDINKKVNELSQILNTHRCVFEGKEVSMVELNQILSEDENRDRRKEAYLVKNQVNQPLVDAGFLDLVKIRTKLAKLNGCDSFVEYKLREQELDVSLFDSWEKELKEVLPNIKRTREKFAKKYLNDTIIYPWDETYITSKIAPSLNKQTNMTNFYTHLTNFFNKFDIDLSSYNITYDIFPRVNKSEWGYNFPIETGKDSRILANVKNKYNEYRVLLHETGHGIHSFLLKPEEIMINRGVSGIISEGIANLFGSFMLDELFYSDFFETNEVKDEFAQLREWNKINSFRAIFRIFFDQQFYKEELKDLDDIYKMYVRLSERLLEEDCYTCSPPWAFLIHHTTHPIYLHNYFMGDVTCEMLRKVFLELHNVTTIADAPQAFGKFLKEEVIAPSGQYTFAELFKSISGDDFSLKYMID
ncbi:MAG: M3 family metallopeptidase [Vallitalea sp.]|jgi:oligoendopeptidase F|nr:M3 family metallopeptidase [Vallitalea sp.]